MLSARKRTVLSLSAASVVLLTLAGCAPASTDSSDAGPIKIGAVSSLTGPAPFPEVPGAAQAVFDRVNAAGGINGRLIEYLSVDDGADPAQASKAARRLVDEDQVVAMVGSASLVECTVNATFYAQQGVVSVPGIGVEPACFASANIAPVNNGTVQGFANLLFFASEELGNTKVCPVILKSPGLTEPYIELIKRWEEATGSTAPLVDTSVSFGDDPTPAILAVRDAGCDAVVFNANEPIAVAFMNTVKRQGLLEGIDWLTLTSAYSESVATELERQGTLGLYANSEFLPFTTDDSRLDDWRSTLDKAEVPLTSLSMGGFVSAEILVDVLSSIDGPITRESVTAAFTTMSEIAHPLLGMPYVFGPGDAHLPNRSSQMVQATESGWVTVRGWAVGQ
jgi:branched-chain amino acid transport system substrate-binding protein